MNAGESKNRRLKVAIVITLLVIVIFFVGFVSIRAQRQRDDLAKLGPGTIVHYDIDPNSFRGRIANMVGEDVVAYPTGIEFRKRDAPLDFSHIIKLQSVKKMAFFGSGVTNEDLELLDQMPNLRTLNISESDISDAGIANLTDLNLVTLVMYNLNPSDAALDSLVKIKTLKWLCIRRDTFSQPAIDKFKLALPDCTVHFPLQ